MLTAFATLLFAQLCPAPSAVQAKLSALRGPAPATVQYSLDVTRDGELITLTARRPDGDIWVQRELPASAPCGELEDAAAVVLLAWEAQLEPGAVPVPEVAARPEPLPVVVARPEPLGLGVRVRAGGEVWLSGASPGWGASGAAELHGQLIGIELGIFGQGRRDVALGPGRATWSRFTVSAGPVATIELTRGVDLCMGAALLTGAFFVAGSGFDQTFSVIDWDLGVSAQARLTLPGLWHLRPFLGVGGVAWLRRHFVQTRTPSAEVLLPEFEANPMVGLVFTP